MIKNDKRFKYTLVVTIMLLFISIIGYSLSFFYNNNSTLVSNIKVNDLLFNITTNSGESDDRILRLQAEKTQSFYVKLKNQNSGTLTFIEEPSRIDVFLVGDGGGIGRKAATGNVGSAGNSGIVVIRAHKEDL